MAVIVKSSVALEPCPFCGGRAELVTGTNMFNMRYARVSCGKCRCTSSYLTEGKTVAFEGVPSRYETLKECIDEAVEKWNHRMKEPIIQDENVKHILRVYEIMVEENCDMDTAELLLKDEYLKRERR